MTRRGTNEFRGSARGLYAGGAGWEYGVEAGGPLWRDRVWIWGAFARNDYLGQSFALASGETLQTRDAFNHLNGKLDAQAFPSNTLTLSGTDFQRRTLGGAGDYYFSLRATSDTYLRDPRTRSRIRRSCRPTCSRRSTSPTCRPAWTDTPRGDPGDQASSTSVASGAATAGPGVRDDKHQAAFSASSFFDTGDFRHELKFGFGYRHVSSIRSELGRRPLIGFSPVGETRARPMSRATRTRSPFSTSTTFCRRHGPCRPPHGLRGARFDYQQGRNLPSAVAANPVFPELLPAIEYPGDRGYPITWRNVEPRVGATYALDRAARSCAAPTPALPTGSTA